MDIRVNNFKINYLLVKLTTKGSLGTKLKKIRLHPHFEEVYEQSSLPAWEEHKSKVCACLNFTREPKYK
jgi:hypothetical protein